MGVKKLPSSKIVSGCIQVYRLADKIIEHRGDAIFLSGNSGGIQTCALTDFYQIDKGLTRKDGQVFSAPTHLVEEDGG